MANIRKNLNRYKELMTGSRLKELNNNIKNYETEINKLKKQQSFLDKMYDRNIMGAGKMRGNNWELAVKYPKSSRLDMYEKYMSNLEKSRDNINRKSKELSKKQIRLNRLKLRDELYAIGEEDTINATRKATAIGAAGLGGAGLATGGGVMAYKHFKKKKQQKNAFDMLDEMHMEKVAGIRQTAIKKLNRYKELMTGSRVRRIEDSLNNHIAKGNNLKQPIENTLSDYKRLSQDETKAYGNYARSVLDDLENETSNSVDYLNKYHRAVEKRLEVSNMLDKLTKKQKVHSALQEKRQQQLADELATVKRARIGTGIGIGGTALLGGSALAYKKNKERR